MTVHHVPFQEEGYEILKNCTHDALGMLGQEYAADRVLQLVKGDWLNILSTASAGEQDKTLQKRLEAFLNRLDQLITGLRKGADGCKSAVTLLEKAVVVLQKFGSFNPMDFVVGQLDRAAELATTELGSIVAQIVDQIIASAEDGDLGFQMEHAIATLEASNTVLRQWSKATSMSVESARKAVSTLESGSASDKALELLDSIGDILLLETNIAEVLTNHSSRVTEIIKANPSPENAREVLLHTELSVMLKERSYSVPSLKGLGSIVAQIGNDQLRPMLQEVKEEIRANLSTPLPPDFVELRADYLQLILEDRFGNVAHLGDVLIRVGVA